MPVLGNAIVCDDDPLVVAVASMVVGQMGFDVVATATSGSELKRLLAESTPHLLVVDQVLPDASSADLLPLVKTAAPECRVIVISGRASADQNEAWPPFARVSKWGTEELAHAVTRVAADLHPESEPLP